MPAILSENGFHTNKEECAKMFTKEWNEKIAQAHVNAILSYRKLIS
jgi:N-acetylmuramoyl-L-alanine amidase